MHQSEPFFITNDTSNQVRVLFSARRDFLKYVTFTIPFDTGFDLHIPGDYFAVIWPGCKGTRLILQKFCGDDSDWNDYSCTYCEFDDMITLVPHSKIKLILEYVEQNTSPASCRMIYMRKDYLESQQKKLYAAEFDIPQHVTILEQTLVSSLQVIEQEDRLRAPGYLDVITNLLDTCIVQLLRVYSNKFLSHETNDVQPVRDTLSGRLPELLDYIRDHCYESFSVKHLAELFNVHRCSLSKSFKKCYNMTLHDYLQQCRVERIMQMLSDEDTPIRLIAEFCGYKSVSSFSKFFRMKTGSSPTQYRRSVMKWRTEGKGLDNRQSSLYDHKNIQE